MSISILVYIVSGLIIIILLWIVLTEYRLRKFFRGAKANSLEMLLVTLNKEVSKTKKSQEEIQKHLKKINEKLSKSIRNIQAIRFNPFIESGSNQSFAISFLNDEGDGVIISSLYARDQMSIFAKPITNGKSKFELTEEENLVLENSK